MLSHLIFIPLICAALLLESSIVPFPLVLFLCLFYILFCKDLLGLGVVFAVSLLLDVLLLNHIGLTPVFLFITLLAFLILEKLFSFQGNVFSAVVIFLSIAMYEIFVGYPFSIFLNIAVLGILAFYIYVNQVNLKKEKNV